MKATLIWLSQAAHPTNHSLQGHTHRSGSETHPWKGTQSLHLYSHRVVRTRVPPPHLRLCWSASTKLASPCVGKPGLSAPRGNLYYFPGNPPLLTFHLSPLRVRSYREVFCMPRGGNCIAFSRIICGSQSSLGISVQTRLPPRDQDSHPPEDPQGISSTINIK